MHLKLRVPFRKPYLTLFIYNIPNWLIEILIVVVLIVICLKTFLIHF
jgi:hypothetical protein